MNPNFPHSICSNEFGFYCVPDEFTEKVVPRVLAKGNVYEPKTLNLLRRHAGTGDVVSGGAFVGDFFPALRAGMADSAMLWSFEPHPISFEAARYTILLNRLEQVRIANVAVGDTKGILPLRIYDLQKRVNAAAASRIVPRGEGDEFVDVEVLPIDDLVPEERSVSILHLDIEGYEMKALHGAARLIHQNAPLIALEAPKVERSEIFLQYLQEEFPQHSYVVANKLEVNVFFIPTAKKAVFVRGTE